MINHAVGLILCLLIQVTRASEESGTLRVHYQEPKIVRTSSLDIRHSPLTQKAVTNCKKYSSENVHLCEKCENDYLLDKVNNTCEKCPKGQYLGEDKGEPACLFCIKKCTVCSSEFTCSACADGFVLTIRTCNTKRGYFLFVMGGIVLGISFLFLAACVLRCIFPCKIWDKKEASMNLFQVSLDETTD